MATDLEEFNFRVAGICLQAISMTWGCVIGFIIRNMIGDALILGVILMLLATFFLSICDETNKDNFNKQTQDTEERWK